VCGDGLGELRGDIVHVGEAVRHAYRQLVAGGPLGEPLANRLREGELAAEAVSLAGGDAEVGRRGRRSGRCREASADLPAVAELVLLVAQAERLSGVLVGLDAADLVLAGLVVEEQDDEARDGGEALEVRAAGEFVAGAGGQQAALARVDDHAIFGRPASDAGRQLPGGREHVGESVDCFSIDRLSVIGREHELIQRDALNHSRHGIADQFDGVEQRCEGFAHRGLAPLYGIDLVAGAAGRLPAGQQRPQRADKAAPVRYLRRCAARGPSRAAIASWPPSRLAMAR
jgi:hypothetical protein